MRKPVDPGSSCDLHAGRLPRRALASTLECVHCAERIPASAAVTFEGLDYLRHFCGAGCLAIWCEENQEK